MANPMLADFAARLAAGLAALLLLTDWRAVPLRFFQTHCQVMLGLLVLAALDFGRAGGYPASTVLAALAAALAFGGSLAWGLGLPRVGVPLAAGVAGLSAWLAVRPAVTAADAGWIAALDASGALASAFLLGATLSAMLLGHHYLTAPAMSIDPLRTFVRCMSWGLAARAALAAAALALWAADGRQGSAVGGGGVGLFLAMRWGMGLAGPALATLLAWKTVQIRSTQSATGILYIAMTLVLFGEVTSLVLAREVGRTL